MGVLTEVRDEGYAIVSLDWPEQKNALGPPEATEVAETIAEVGRSDSVNALIITGTGDAFCAGGNIKGMVERANMPAEERRRLVYSAYQGLIRELVAVPIPTIAALDGPAVGMGFDIALACDRRLFGPGGWARQGWGRIGAVPGTGGELFLRLKAPGALWRILPEQPRVNGELAERLGLGEDVRDQSALEAAHGAALALAQMPPATVRGYVELSRTSVREQLEDHLAACLRIQVGLLADPRFAERAQQALANKASS
ncbi:enoyl-CoA hydratase/isomerase family protein [Phytohabitans suffuscus]|uniref:Enoyl-CoA hydratase n=1 Tax=Phytohabitans suffuscus TaxID=624315 RepID=A0A6F8YRY7_9ACTN|nr:enoyl-CoA hydratase/isomerase family protein [Phytohabitans suffuscus]BCB88601.1 enoyl-CoA hydratase [Phytohabitans suffuscus]